MPVEKARGRLGTVRTWKKIPLNLVPISEQSCSFFFVKLKSLLLCSWVIVQGNDDYNQCYETKFCSFTRILIGDSFFCFTDCKQNYLSIFLSDGTTIPCPTDRFRCFHGEFKKLVAEKKILLFLTKTIDNPGQFSVNPWRSELKKYLQKTFLNVFPKT